MAVNADAGRRWLKLQGKARKTHHCTHYRREQPVLKNQALIDEQMKLEL